MLKNPFVLFVFPVILSLACATLTKQPINDEVSGRFENLVIFGDSFSDNGVDVNSDVHGFNRYSNGPIWSDYLAKKMELAYNASTNMAYSGAKSGWGNYFFNDWSGVLWQINKYLCLHEKVPEKTLIALQAGGGNDLFDGSDVASRVIENNLKGLRKLAKRGAKNILLLNIPDVTLMPGYKHKPFVHLKSYVAGRIGEANRKIESKIRMSFQKEYPTVSIYYYDWHGDWWNIMEKFPDVQNPFDRRKFGLNQEEVWKHFWYDQHHMTTSVHKIVADKLYDVLLQNNLTENKLNKNRNASLL